MILRQWPSRLRRRRRLSASLAPVRLMTTRSTAGSPIRVMRKDSRITRLIRLRSTALPDVFREMAIPKRASPKVFPRASTVNSESVDRALPRKTWENSVGLVRRLRRGKVWEGLMLRRSVRTISPSIRDRALHGPWRDDGKVPDGRPWLPYGHGNHGCARA